MRMFIGFLLLYTYTTAVALAQPVTPCRSLNDYVAFLNQSVAEVTNRFQMVKTYYPEANQYRKKPTGSLRLPSSGPLEPYYYKKVLTGSGLTTAEKQSLNATVEAVWQLLNTIDQTGKALETYVRLNEYQRDGLKQSDALISQMQTLFGQFGQARDRFHKQIQQVYRRYQPYRPTDAYLATENDMERVLLSQKQLLDTLTFYLRDDSPSTWPVERVKQSILDDEAYGANFGKQQAQIKYPALAMVGRFKEAIQSMQAVKRRAVDDYTFAARQSARHSNAFYSSLLNEYNQDLLASYDAFVDYSNPVKPLLHAVKRNPVFTIDGPAPVVQPAGRTLPFRDTAPAGFAIKPAASPASVATFQALTGYVEFINESLRQMHTLQILLRNYQISAESYRDPARPAKWATLAYAHDDYKVPVSAYQLLLSTSRHIPEPYRASLNGQAEVLMNILKEMDGLSIDLITYTKEKQYLQDWLQRSDAILDRYATLFDALDQKKEHLYQDVRRVYESYPAANPSSSWYVAGKALLKMIDDNHDILFGIKAYLKGETDRLPMTNTATADARALIANEYQNLKGLQRYGRSNGLCPYSPYEDIGEYSLRFAETSQKIRAGTARNHPYESVYYLYNNELIYQYNKFSELAKVGVLKTINQPDVFLLQREPHTAPNVPLSQPAEPLVQQPASESKVEAVPSAVGRNPVREQLRTPVQSTSERMVQHDTVYVNQTKVDTVYVDRAGPQGDVNSLTGFAANNMVLLLDVSSSMDSPYKMPLLKRSIKSLLTYLRPEDQVSIVVYSGKARVVLKPTSGADTAEISRVIDGLQSAGDTDGNEGIRLAYKLANKHYIRAGNNRIVLATDGEFSISDEVQTLVGENTRQDVYLTVFTFGRNEINSRNLKRIALTGKGNYVHVTSENANRQLILEAQGKKTR